MKPSFFKTLPDAEESTFRDWARTNYVIGEPINSVWHPVVQHECTIMNMEQYRQHQAEEKYADEIALLHAMKDYGGHFASNLAAAWMRADIGNRQILRDGFWNLLENYKSFLPRSTTPHTTTQYVIESGGLDASYTTQELLDMINDDPVKEVVNKWMQDAKVGDWISCDLPGQLREVGVKSIPKCSITRNDVDSL